MQQRSGRLILSILASNGAALALMLLASLATRLLAPAFQSRFQTDPAGIYILSDFILIPGLMGLICAAMWQDLDLSRGEQFGYSTLNLFAAFLMSVLVLREGSICIIMASPLVVLFYWIGYRIGRPISDSKNRPLKLSVVPLLLVAMAADVVTVRGHEGQVTDTVTVHAPARQVWRYIIDYPAIAAPPNYWLWRIGLPAPIQSTATGHQAGATRRCVFTGNIAFTERITDVEPEHSLAFDVTSQPDHPEVVGHFVLHRGQFVLYENADGTTTVTGTTWYTLNVHPAAYYDLWAHDIVRHVHLRVMEHIKTLAEGNLSPK